jgi:hypothetical protein
MTDPAPYVSRFTNRYGEEWQFEYDYSRAEGILSGSDADWQKYGVVGGRARGLILNEEEIQWLRKAWLEATSAR